MNFKITGDKLVWGVAGAAIGATVAYLAIDYYLYRKLLNETTKVVDDAIDNFVEKHGDGKSYEELVKDYKKEETTVFDDSAPLFSLYDTVLDTGEIEYDTIAWSKKLKMTRTMPDGEIVWSGGIDVNKEINSFLNLLDDDAISQLEDNGCFYMLFEDTLYEIDILNDEDPEPEPEPEYPTEPPKKLKAKAVRRRVRKEDNE